MTVETDVASDGPFIPNGVTTTFAFTFKAFDETDVRVIRLSPIGAEVIFDPALYEVIPNPGDGGNVEFLSPPAAGDPIYIQLDPDFVQDTQLPDPGPYLPSVIEVTFDQLEQRINWLRARLDRAVTLTFGEAGPVLPVAAQRANMILAFDINGNISLISSNLQGVKGDKGDKGDTGAPGAPGLSGSGSGDVIAANNGTEFNAAAFRSNLGLIIGTNIQAFSANLTVLAGIATSANIRSLLGAADYGAARTLLSLVPGTDVQAHSAALDAITADPHMGVRNTESFIVTLGDEVTPLTAGVAKFKFRLPYAFTVTAVRLALSTAQTSGGLVTVDINESGASILSTKLTANNGATTSVGATTPAVVSDPSLADDAEMSFDIDSLGDNTAKGAKVTIIGYKT